MATEQEGTAPFVVFRCSGGDVLVVDASPAVGTGVTGQSTAKVTVGTAVVVLAA